MIRIADFQALTFDCYGTLIDWERGIADALGDWATRHGVEVGDEALLALFARHEAEVEQAHPGMLYRDVLAAVHRRIAAELLAGGTAVSSADAAAQEFADSVGSWRPFTDTREALQALKRRYKLVVVSNVDRRSFASTARELGVALDAAVLAEDVGAYKPDHRMFERAFDVLAEMGVARSGILHVAQSLFHDHVPAKELALRTVWVNRRHGQAGGGATLPAGFEVRPDLTVTSLAELVALDDRQRAS